MTSDVLLVPNVGAEEGPVWRSAPGEGAIRSVARLWRLLFGPEARLVGDEPAGLEAVWPAALGAVPEAAAFPRLDRPGGAFAWLNTEEAREIAARAGCPLEGAPPEATARVHDKAFALAAAREAGFEPRELAGAIDVFEPDELRNRPDDVVRRIDERLAAWPAWMRGDFTLKPRFGGSGRGRVPGTSESADTDEVRGALARLAERGGAVLEPWLARRADLSAQLWIEPEEGVVLLGTLELLVTPAGVYRGHRGTIDRRGRVTSGRPEDEALREAAAAVASAARDAGYRGPCGVDAFVFAGPDERDVLRPVVELNARFTLGTVAIGLLRRALPRLRGEVLKSAGARHRFRFTLDGTMPDEPVELSLPLSSDAAGPLLTIGAEPGSPGRAEPRC